MYTRIHVTFRTPSLNIERTRRYQQTVSGPLAGFTVTPACVTGLGGDTLATRWLAGIKIPQSRNESFPNALSYIKRVFSRPFQFWKTFGNILFLRVLIIDRIQQWNHLRVIANSVFDLVVLCGLYRKRGGTYQ